MTADATPFWATPEGHAYFTSPAYLGTAPVQPTTPSVPLPTDPNNPLGFINDAQSILNSALEGMGLGNLGPTAWALWQQGESLDQIMLQIRQTPEYKARYPAMEQLSKDGRAISEAQYIDYERSVSQLFQSAGLPKGFYDQPDDFTNFLLNNVALPELQSRVDLYTNITMQQPREVRQALQDMYGITPGEMIAYFIDPNRALPLIQQRVNASQAAGMAQITGYGTLTQNEAERVASYGVSEPQEQQGFSQLAQMGQIFNPLIGRTGDAIDRAAQLSAAFGQGAGDIATIEQKRRQLLAEYQGGGDFAASQKGLSGIGTAQ